MNYIYRNLKCLFNFKKKYVLKLFDSFKIQNEENSSVGLTQRRMW